MQATSPPTIGMDLEDFRRLGVRPYETRLTVIRLAALRSAKSLAERQLESPSEQVGVQLSRVATSAYRLLDPRQRDDAIQRAHVGRILPSAPNWAGQTQFQDASVKVSVTTAFHPDSLSDMERIAMLDLDGPPRFEDEVQSWTVSWNDEDLPKRASRRYPGSRLRSYLKTPWILGAVAGLILGMALGLTSLLQSDWPSMLLSTSDESPTGTSAAALHALGTIEPDARTAGAELESSTIDDPPASPSWNLWKVPSDMDLLQPSEADLAPIPPLQVWLDRTEQQLEDLGAEERVGSADREASTEQTTSLQQAAAGRVDASAWNSAPPSKAQRRAARQHLQSLLPELDQTPLPSRVVSRIEKLEALQQELESGSPDSWVARIMIAELAWLVEDGSQVSERLKWLAEDQGSARNDLLSQTFVAACAVASLPETHQHLLDNGLILADRLLVDESFEACLRVLAAVTASAEILESEKSIAEIEKLSEAVIQATRLYNASRRWLDASGEPIPGSDLGVLGRYHCLMLRKWEIGLPWLTEVSDSRIASVARQEMELGDSVAPADRIGVCRLWLAIADRSRGRIADSIRLHAVDLMKDAIPHTSGLKKLELERATEEALGRLPSYLR